MLDFSAALLLGLSCSLSIASCTQVQHQSQVPPGKVERNANLSPSGSESQAKRTAIPDIEGCSRDQTTFYKGEVLSFRRTAKSTEITVKTEWDTTEKLTQMNKGQPIQFRLEGRPIKDSEWKQIESTLAAHSPVVQATVWICKEKNKDIIKIVDWILPTN